MPQLPRPSVVSAMKILRSDHNHTAFTWGPLLGVVWRHETTVTAARALTFDLQKFAAGLPDGKGILMTVVMPHAPLPSSDARQALSGILRVGADALICSAVVMEGDGFRASAVRSVATGLAIIARQPFPHRVFPRTDSALAWFAQELRTRSSVSLDIEQLGRDLSTLRLPASNVA
jgi:hypothetical protein